MDEKLDATGYGSALAGNVIRHRYTCIAMD
jgi:hypothetical protein